MKQLLMSNFTKMDIKLSKNIKHLLLVLILSIIQKKHQMLYVTFVIMVDHSIIQVVMVFIGVLPSTKKTKVYQKSEDLKVEYVLGHQNQVNLTMLLMELTVVYGEEMVGHLKNLLVLGLQHKATFMGIHMNVNVLMQSLIGFLKV